MSKESKAFSKAYAKLGDDISWNAHDDISTLDYVQCQEDFAWLCVGRTEKSARKQLADEYKASAKTATARLKNIIKYASAALEAVPGALAARLVEVEELEFAGDDSE